MSSESTASALPWFLRPWISQALLLGLALILLIPGTAEIPLMDRDEPKFAQATWEMIERGEWFVPYFNEGYRFDKPVLSYWWMRVHFWMFGKTELAARLHSVISAWLTALVIQALGTFLYSRQAGFWAAFCWLTCLQVLVHGRLCVADMPMLLGVAITLWALCRLFIPDDPPPRFSRWFWVLLGGMVLGFLAKGPIAMAVPILGLLLARFVFYRKPIPWMRLQPVPLTFLFLLGIGLWGIPALIATKGQFWDEGIGTHVVERGTAAFNGRIIVPGFYLVTAFLSLFPWSTLLPSALGPDRAARNSMGGAILLGVFVAPFIIFTPYATQLPHYILPGFPAFFLLLTKGGGIPQPSNPSRGVCRFLHWTSLTLAGLGVFCLVFSVVLSGMLRTLALILAPSLMVFGGLVQGLSRNWFWTVTGAILAGALGFLLVILNLNWGEELVLVRRFLLLGGLIFLLAGLVVLTIPKRNWRVALPLAFLALLCMATFGKTLRSMHPVIAVHEILEARFEDGIPKNQKFRAWKFTEPSLVFYTRSGWEFKGKDEELKTAVDWIGNYPNRTAIFLLKEWTLASQVESLNESGSFTGEPSSDYEDAVLGSLPEDEFVIHRVRGLNMARTSWVDMVVVFPKTSLFED